MRTGCTPIRLTISKNEREGHEKKIIWGTGRGYGGEGRICLKTIRTNQSYVQLDIH